MYWRYDLNPHLTELLRNQIVTKGVDAVTINLLELCGVVMTTHVTQVFCKTGKNARRFGTVEGGGGTTLQQGRGLTGVMDRVTDVPP